MRNVRLTLGMLPVALLLLFSACQKEEAIMPGADKTEIAVADFQLDDITGLVNPEVSEASETMAFGLRERAPGECKENHDRQETTHHKEADKQSLAFILRQLNLSQEQRKMIKGFVDEEGTCVREHRAAVRERHQDLVNKANALREDYIKAYRAGRITKVQLEEKLSTLRERLHAQLRQDEQAQMRLRIMQKCRAELMANIASVLNREQLPLFNRWRASLK